jgi:predicted ATP-grasp superfamily ATP-dependent carboligase
MYLQEYVEGDACSATYVGEGRHARLLGVTHQLVGESWLHAAPFHYCGSIGPLSLDASLRAAFERLGTALVEGCQLRGLFGVDCVLRDGIPWPVEINPRYTASVEVLEYATGIRALALHRQVFDPTAPVPSSALSAAPALLVGKAIMFAKAPLAFPQEGPWLPSLQISVPHQELPAFADIPPAGQFIEAGRPILTLFARADSPAACLDSLRQTAQPLDRWLSSR